MLVWALSNCSSGSSSSNLQVIYDRKGEKLPDQDARSDQVDWTILSQNSPEGVIANSVGLLRISSGFGNCTAFLLKSTPQKVGVPSYAVTSGHCLKGPSGEFLEPDRVFTNYPLAGELVFNFFKDAPFSTYKVVTVKGVQYSTMKSIDLGLLELSETSSALSEQGFLGLSLASNLQKVPDVSDSTEHVILIGIPFGGLSENDIFLRYSNCSAGNNVPLLREGTYSFTQTIQHQCSALEGSSGSPLLLMRDHNLLPEVLAIHTTSVKDNTSGLPDCDLNRPCEVYPDGAGGWLDPVSKVAENYAQSLASLAGCFTEDGFFDLYLASCKLEKPQ